MKLLFKQNAGWTRLFYLPEFVCNLPQMDSRSNSTGTTCMMASTVEIFPSLWSANQRKSWGVDTFYSGTQT